MFPTLEVWNNLYFTIESLWVVLIVILSNTYLLKWLKIVVQDNICLANANRSNIELLVWELLICCTVLTFLTVSVIMRNSNSNEEDLYW